MENNKTLKLLYAGTMILCGVVAGLWAFTANRFQVYESFGIMIGGMASGIGLGMILQAVVTMIKR